VRLSGNPFGVHIIDSSTSGFGMKKPDIGIATVPEKLSAYLVLTTSLKKLIVLGGLHHEMVLQCVECMQILLFPQQPERERFYALGGGADGIELWAWEPGTGRLMSTGILPLSLSKTSASLQFMVRLTCTSPEALGYKAAVLPEIKVDGQVLTDVRRLDAGDDPVGSPSQKATTAVVVGVLNGEKVVGKRSNQSGREVSCPCTSTTRLPLTQKQSAVYRALFVTFSNWPLP
jgi:hypothetical protein